MIIGEFIKNKRALLVVLVMVYMGEAPLIWWEMGNPQPWWLFVFAIGTISLGLIALFLLVIEWTAEG